MDIRNILHQKRENKKRKIRYFATGIVVLIIIALLIVSINKNNKKPTYQVGDSIQISGTISIDNNYPINTHKISNEDTSFGTKSSSINLNYLTDKIVILNGTIEELSIKHPILAISNIKEPTSNLIINNNKYFFTNEFISFDFSQDTKIRAEKNDKYIQIYYEDEPIVSVETFICNKVTPTQNCENLIHSYTKNLNEMFTTFLGYTFYKNKEDSWVTFNDQTLGYIFKTSDNEFLLDISHLINIVNSKFIAENKLDLIKENCKNSSGTYLEQVSKVSTQIIDTNLTKFEIEGTSNEKEKVICKLTTDIRNDRKIKNHTLKDLEK